MRCACQGGEAILATTQHTATACLHACHIELHSTRPAEVDAVRVRGICQRSQRSLHPAGEAARSMTHEFAPHRTVSLHSISIVFAVAFRSLSMDLRVLLSFLLDGQLRLLSICSMFSSSPVLATFSFRVLRHDAS